MIGAARRTQRLMSNGKSLSTTFEHYWQMSRGYQSHLYARNLKIIWELELLDSFAWLSALHRIPHLRRECITGVGP